MKKIILFLILSFSSFAQDREFTFTKEGFTDYVVTEVPGKTKEELFKKTLDWVNFSYNNPKEVIKAQIENDYIRLEGTQEGLVSGFMGSTFPIRYQLEISFKDDKYKFDVLKIEYYVKGNQYGSGGWRNYELNDVKGHYKKNGELKSTVKNEHETFPAYFNKLNSDLESFIKSSEIPSKKSDW